jgi:hypothetical protein
VSAKGEMYKSMKAMKKHEMNESPALRKKEYGSATGGMKKKPGIKKPTIKKKK